MVEGRRGGPRRIQEQDMPTYMLLLDSGIGRPIEEALTAADDGEAKMLAELRLSLTTDYLQVAVIRDERLLATLTRDSVMAGRRAPSLKLRSRLDQAGHAAALGPVAAGEPGPRHKPLD
jgi:hypothetical protein